MVLRRLLLSGAAALVLCGAGRAQDAVPWDKYSTPVEPVGRSSPPKIEGRFAREYRSQLREAARHAPDFAGHYILATWGCGASCVMGAAIDIRTGKVIQLPFTVSDWPLEVQEPLTYKLESRLLIVRGSRNERGLGTYAYEFTGTAFRPVSGKDKRSQ